ncbi:MAG: tripartite tricarboxylate transporter TctB family protein [Rhizobiales bacterium]|jgi:hypothetical protein|nr:tripartite tricarboxylate transporter TctB family protein [Hyphomicrobiales bacterium]
MVSRRNLELITALLTGAFGVAVIISSTENGISWSEEGVGSGTFPFLTGLVILGGSIVNLVRGAVSEGGIALHAPEVKRWLGLFVPATLFVAFIPLLGLYVSTALYVFGSIAVHGVWSNVKAAAFAIAFAAAVYILFEWMFLVYLPHGWLGSLLGW